MRTKIVSGILLVTLSITLLLSAAPKAYARDGGGSSPLGPIGDAIQGVLDWLWQNIVKPVIDGIGYVFQGILNAIRAPFDALVSVWNTWWTSLLGFGWYSPIIGFLVVAACIIIVIGLWKLLPYAV